LSRELLALSDDEFRAAFKGSPMKRAKLGGLKRNAAVVLWNVGNRDDNQAPTQSPRNGSTDLEG
jgi:epoxyqueuosine reductase